VAECNLHGCPSCPDPANEFGLYCVVHSVIWQILLTKSVSRMENSFDACDVLKMFLNRGSNRGIGAYMTGLLL